MLMMMTQRHLIGDGNVLRMLMPTGADGLPRMGEGHLVGDGNVLGGSVLMDQQRHLVGDGNVLRGSVLARARMLPGLFPSNCPRPRSVHFLLISVQMI